MCFLPWVLFRIDAHRIASPAPRCLINDILVELPTTECTLAAMKAANGSLHRHISKPRTNGAAARGLLVWHGWGRVPGGLAQCPIPRGSFSQSTDQQEFMMRFAQT